MSDQVRSFIAILLPPVVKRGIYQFANPLQQLPLDVKWVEKENYHLTLKFLGSLTIEEIQKVKAFLQRFTAQVEPFYLKCGGLVVFPNQRRPRVLCLSLEGETESVQSLWKAVESGLAQVGFPEEKRKKFHPHITLGRFRSAGDMHWEKIKAEAGSCSGEKFMVHELFLMASKLTPMGPEYRDLARYSFQVKE